MLELIEISHFFQLAHLLLISDRHIDVSDVRLVPDTRHNYNFADTHTLITIFADTHPHTFCFKLSYILNVIELLHWVFGSTACLTLLRSNLSSCVEFGCSVCGCLGFHGYSGILPQSKN